MNTRKAAMLAVTVVLAGPAVASALEVGEIGVAHLQFAVAAPAQLGGMVFNETFGKFRVFGWNHQPLEQVRAQRGALQLTWPSTLEFVRAERQDDGELVFTLRGETDTRELFEFYRRLLAAQRYRVAGADFNVEDGGLFAGRFDAEHIEAVFERLPDRQSIGYGAGVFNYPEDYPGAFDGERVNVLIDREDAYTYSVHVEPQAGDGWYDGYARPVFSGADYAFHGAIGYAGYAALPPDADRLRLVAPSDARDFQLVRPTRDLFRYRFKSRQPLRVIADFYARILADQGFRRVSGELAGNAGEFVFSNGERRVALHLTGQGDGRYEAEFDVDVD